MTPKGELCVEISEEFIQAYPDMKAHFMLLWREPDGEPMLAVDEIALLALQRWSWHEGYHYRERVRALLSVDEEHTGGTIFDRLCSHAGRPRGEQRGGTNGGHRSDGDRSPLPRRRRAS
jgi:hypothetical protein